MQIRSALPTTLLLVTCIIGTTHADETCVDYRPWDIEFSRTWIPDDPWDIAHAADHLFTACGDGGLRIFAESTPDQWTEVSQTPVPGFAFGVAAEGQLAVVAAGELVVLDVTDPTAPVPLASVPISGRCVRLTSGFAVVGRDQPGLVSVVDLRVPSSPTVTDVVVPALDGTAAPGLPHDVETFGGVAAFGFDGGVFLLDVSDPENPASLGDAIVSHSVRDISERNGILYLAADSGGLVILDATDPLDPVQIANYGGGYARAVLVVGDTAVLPGLRFLDVSDPHTPTLFRTRGMSSLMSLFEIRPGEVCAGFHVLAAPPGGGELVTFDVPELANPTLEDPAPFPSYRHVATDGDRLATFEDGNFELWDVRQPLDPQLLGLVSAQVGYGVTFHGADLEGDVAVGGGTYEGFFDYYDALKTFDVSDPQAPQYTGSVVGLPEGTGGWVRLHGGLAYVPSGEGIRQYATPDLSYIGTISGVMDFWSAMEFAGDFLCVTGEGLEVFDLPGGGVAAYLPLPETYTAGLAIDANTAFVTASSFLYAVDIQDPHAPALVGSLDLSPWKFGGSNSLPSPTVVGDHAYLVLDGTIQVVDVSDPTNLQRVTEFPWTGPLYWVTSYAGRVVAVGSGLMALPECSVTSTAAVSALVPSRFLRISPNPFHDRVAIEYVTGAPMNGPVRLDVFDVRGRRVRALDQLGLGASQVAWDGRNAAGRPVAAGVYFIRAARGDEAMTRAVVRMK